MSIEVEVILISSVFGLAGVIISAYLMRRESPGQKDANKAQADFNMMQASNILINNLQEDADRKEKEYQNLLAVLNKERVDHERDMQNELHRRGEMERVHNALFRWGDENERRLRRANMEYASYKAPNGTEEKIQKTQK